MVSLKKIATGASVVLSLGVIAAGAVAVGNGLLVAAYHSVTVDSITDLQNGNVKSGISDGPVAADIAAAAVPLLSPACNACKVGRETQATYAGHKNKAVAINFEQAGIACFTLDRAVTPDASGKCSDGACVCFVGQAGERIVTKPDYKMLVQTEHGKQHSGICSTTVALGPDELYAPCDADADCADYDNGATCTAAASVTAAQLANVGVFVAIRHAGAAAAPAITVEKLLVK